jgi:hypothetical protein
VRPFYIQGQTILPCPLVVYSEPYTAAQVAEKQLFGNLLRMESDS